MGAGVLQESGEDKIELSELLQRQNVLRWEASAQLATAGERFAGRDPSGVGLADGGLDGFLWGWREIVGDNSSRQNGEAEQECCRSECWRDEGFWNAYHVITARDRSRA